jgi:UDP-N-acetylglucosamine acyltransferase
MKPQTPNTVLGLNVVGMRRAGFTPDQRKQVKAAFRLLYFSGLNIREAAVRLRASFADGPALEIAEFIEKSSRGVCAPARRSAGGFDEAEEE